MTVIVWDGKTLAADKLAVYNDLRFTITKLYVVEYLGETTAIGITGKPAIGERMMAWYLAGADEKTFESVSEENFTRLIVARKGKPLLNFEAGPCPITYEDAYSAFGSGSSVAMGALDTMVRMGATPNAVLAVEIAGIRCTDCGHGCDFHTFE